MIITASGLILLNIVLSDIFEERTITTFNNLCLGQSYSASQIYNAIQSDSGFNDIKLFRESSWTSKIDSRI